jgi:hypothetical protein
MSAASLKTLDTKRMMAIGRAGGWPPAKLLEPSKQDLRDILKAAVIHTAAGCMVTDDSRKDRSRRLDLKSNQSRPA